jgi:hypothetical protein
MQQQQQQYHHQQQPSSHPSAVNVHLQPHKISLKKHKQQQQSVTPIQSVHSGVFLEEYSCSDIESELATGLQNAAVNTR